MQRSVHALPATNSKINEDKLMGKQLVTSESGVVTRLMNSGQHTVVFEDVDPNKNYTFNVSTIINGKSISKIVQSYKTDKVET